jgi:hypothetical protein
MFSRTGFFRPQKSYNISFNGTSAASPNPVTYGTAVVRLTGTADCYIALNTAASSSNGMLVRSTVPEFVLLNSGDVINVIQSGGAGTLNVTEMSA